VSTGPPAQSARLVGSTLKTLHADASVMAGELGVDDPYEPPQARDDAGRFAGSGRNMNRVIREASGRRRDSEAGSRDSEGHDRAGEGRRSCPPC
jgi:hypothetical protein